MRLPRFFIGLGTGLLLATFGILSNDRYPAALKASVIGASSSSSSAPVIRSAMDVQTAGWKEYRNPLKQWEFKYPTSYVLTEENGIVTLTSDIDTRRTVTLQRLQGSLQNAWDSAMQQAGWKIADRQTFALSTPYFMNDADHLTATYLFLRDYLQKPDADPSVVVKATITLPRGDTTFRSASGTGIVDVDSVMTEPEQILSTFRFVQLDEIMSE